jgi:histidine ammonia-lyase
MIFLDGTSLTLDDLEVIAAGRPAIGLSDTARSKVETGRRALETAMADGAAIYGVNTGFGDLASVRIPDDRLETLQERLILSHAAGMGEPLAAPVVRVMLALRANTLARGHSGVRVVVLDRLLDLLREDVLPVVPSRGSVGASGDLAPLAHLALPLLGVGEVVVAGVRRPAGAVLAEHGWQPLRLAAKEGLALINGTQAMTAVLALALRQARDLARAADLVGALTTDALRGTDTAFDHRIHALRPHAGQIASARNLWTLLQGSAIRESHRVEDVRVQDPYCVRCMPQVHGAARDVFDTVARRVEVEVNSVTDNPLVFVGGDGRAEVLSGGNFHGEPMAIAADAATIAVAELGAISERRIEKLTNAAFSGLPPFLVREAGLNSGFMIAQVTAAALASENKTLAHPASVDTLPTSADKEDHVSMGMWAAIKFSLVVENVRRILGIEAVAAAQGIDLLRPLTSSPALERVHASLRATIEPWDADRWMAPDLAAGEVWLSVEASELARELV